MANKIDNENSELNHSIISPDQIAKIKAWLQSVEGNNAIIKVQKENADINRKILEMNNYDVSLLKRPYTI